MKKSFLVSVFVVLLFNLYLDPVFDFGKINLLCVRENLKLLLS